MKEKIKNLIVLHRSYVYEINDINKIINDKNFNKNPIDIQVLYHERERLYMQLASNILEELEYNGIEYNGNKYTIDAEAVNTQEEVFNAFKEGIERGKNLNKTRCLKGIAEDLLPCSHCPGCSQRNECKAVYEDNKTKNILKAAGSDYNIDENDSYKDISNNN